MNGPRWLYCHGFASGPNSTKGVKLSEHFAARGVALERLDLRAPSLERLSFPAMKDVVTAALGGARDRAVLFGSSLGAGSPSPASPKQTRASRRWYCWRRPFASPSAGAHA